MKNKILSVTLCGLLLSQPVLAQTPFTSNSILDNALSNFTEATSVNVVDRNGKDVKTMYYTGGYYFRFMNGKSVPPAWSFSPGAIEAGCNGINMKGMFVSLLSLDQFGSMLQNAGTSLAWGIGIGLVYSLPGVGNVFKMLNQWAHDLQKLLGMSCQAGIAIGQSIGNKMKETDAYKEVSNKVQSAFSAADLPAGLQDGDVKKAVKGLGLSDVDFSWDRGFEWTGAESNLTEAEKRGVLSEQFKKLFNDRSLGGAILSKFLKSNVSGHAREKISKWIDDDSKEKKNPFGVIYTDLLYDGNLEAENNGVHQIGINNISDNYQPYSGLISAETKEAVGMRLLTYAIYMQHFKDLGYTKESLNSSIKNLSDEFKKSSLSANSSSKEGDKSITKFVTSPEQTGIMSVTRASLVGGGTGANKAAELKDFLLKGTTNQNNQLKAPRFALIYAQEGTNDLDKGYLFVPTEVGDANFFDGNAKFIGIQNMARCGVYNSLSNILGGSNGGVDPTLDVFKKDENGVSLDCENYKHLTFSHVKNYGSIISQSSMVDKNEALSVLKDYYVIELSKIIIDNMLSTLYLDSLENPKIQNGIGNINSKQHIVSPDPDELRTYQENITQFQTTLKEVRAEIEKNSISNKESNGFSINSYFKELDKTNKTNSSKNQN